MRKICSGCEEVQQNVGGSGDVDERWRGEESSKNATTKEREELYLGRDWNGKSERNKGIPSAFHLHARGETETG